MRERRSGDLRERRTDEGRAAAGPEKGQEKGQEKGSVTLEALLILPLILISLILLIRFGGELWRENLRWPEERGNSQVLSAAEAIRLTDLALDQARSLKPLIPDWFETLRK